MKTFTFIIKDELGIHARPAGLLVKEAQKYESAIKIEKDGKSAMATKLLMLMALGVKKGDKIVISVEGNDEQEAITSMQTFFENNLSFVSNP